MQCSVRAGVKPTVAAARPQRFSVKVHAVRPDLPLPQADTVAERANSLARVAATGALSALVAASALLSANVAHAGADLALGKQVFDSNCAACHAGGNNTVISDHTLRKAAIESFLDGGLKLESIVYQGLCEYLHQLSASQLVCYIRSMPHKQPQNRSQPNPQQRHLAIAQHPHEQHR